MLDAYLYAGLRTPFGRVAGALAPVRPDDLVATVIRHVLEHSPFRADQVEDVVLGCACQAGEDSRNVARHAALLAGLPPSTPGQTVNRLCASGLAAVLDTARAITSGEGELYVTGGVESMSRAPFVIAKSEAAFGREFKVYDSAIGARFPNPLIERQFGADTMPQTADNVASELGLTREDSDRFAAASQAKFAAAQASGFLAGEILPVSVPTGKKTPPKVIDIDEHPRADTTVETLGTLRALQAGGVTTAGNASGVNDGAVALLVGNRAIGETAGIEPMARILAGAAVGVEPRVMGIGPAYAIPKALERAGLTLGDVDVIEINEAFAAQVLGCLKLLNVAFDDPRVNPNGGAIAVGHPLGASGARILLNAARELERRGGRYAVVSLCIGMGQGLAVVIERV
ncbi:3-oxoadipyl-CoA thiolase [Burkholderia sp. Ac-20345]|uniref:3-oxoadipyl-CoA thiolase n=1 Tax=Burkholderia sp. Ac-20345 TaxID=2703891 RepID=UPI00197C13DF|nr:3-oxoadipyl-CoA thiolase [Burkholderia sp. Ac-20345]MBN3777995.1 3-oxoadipyl-CoA thiolase [Burkholderia sp. Ac-20345]